jgi:hypothetical protein
MPNLNVFICLIVELIDIF